MVLVAFEFWNGQGKVELGELLSALHSDRLQRLGTCWQQLSAEFTSEST
jgi:hypothetical protein